ncbi:MAG: hypothetical protein ACOVMM_10870 [Chitinophagaceae bacterium]
MNNNFENKVQEALDGFLIEPSVETWKNIEQQLPQKKKRRVAFWWMFAASVAIVSTVVFFSTRDLLTQKNNSSNTFQSTNTQQKEAKSSSQNKNNSSTQNTFNNVNNTKLSISKQQKIATSQTNINSSNSKNPKSINIISNQYQNIIAQTITNPTTNEHEDVLTLEPIIKTNQSDELLLTDKNLNIGNPTKNLDLAFNVNTNPTKNSKKVTQKWNLNLAFATGVQQVGNNTLFNNASTSKSENNFSNTGGLTGGLGATPISNINNNYTILPLPKAGVNLKFGITANKQLNKTFAVSTGILYQYTHNKSMAILDSVGANSTFYIVSNNQAFVNSSHSFQIPMQLQTTLLKTKTTKISFITGVAGNWYIASNYLQQSENKNLYIQNTSNFNSYQWSLQTGFGFGFNDKIMGQIILHQGLTPIHSSGVKNYFSGIDAMISIPMQSIFKTKK